MSDKENKGHIINLQVRDAVDETSRAGDVVLQRTLVMKERETVTDLVTEDSTMDMLGVRESCSVGVTTARSLGITITRRMTAVRGRRRTSCTFMIYLQYFYTLIRCMSSHNYRLLIKKKP